MKLVIARSKNPDVDLLIGSPGYTIWKGVAKEKGGRGLEGEEKRTLDPITELDLDGEHLLYLLGNSLLDAETCYAFFMEEGHVSLKYLREKYRTNFIDFQGTIFRDSNGLPCCLYLAIHPDTFEWGRLVDFP